MLSLPPLLQPYLSSCGFMSTQPVFCLTALPFLIVLPGTFPSQIPEQLAPYSLAPYSHATDLKFQFWNFFLFFFFGILFSFVCFFFFFWEIIYLAAAGLSCGLQALSCSLWDLVSWSASLHWKLRVLAIGLPGKSLLCFSNASHHLKILLCLFYIIYLWSLPGKGQRNSITTWRSTIRLWYR